MFRLNRAIRQTLRTAPRRTVVTTKYTKSHEWISYDTETGLGRLGITTHAANQLGDVVFIELPQVEQTVAPGSVLGCIESVKAAAEFYSPVALTVKEINDALTGEPELVNTDAEGSAFIAVVELADPAQLDSLMTKEEYSSLTA